MSGCVKVVVVVVVVVTDRHIKNILNMFYFVFKYLKCEGHHFIVSYQKKQHEN